MIDWVRALPQLATEQGLKSVGLARTKNDRRIVPAWQAGKADPLDPPTAYVQSLMDWARDNGGRLRERSIKSAWNKQPSRRLKFRARCSVCGVEIPVGDMARYRPGRGSARAHVRCPKEATT